MPMSRLLDVQTEILNPQGRIHKKDTDWKCKRGIQRAEKDPGNTKKKTGLLAGIKVGVLPAAGR